jgi:hypothetical protein
MPCNTRKMKVKSGSCESTSVGFPPLNGGLTETCQVISQVASLWQLFNIHCYLQDDVTHAPQRCAIHPELRKCQSC